VNTELSGTTVYFIDFLLVRYKILNEIHVE